MTEDNILIKITDLLKTKYRCHTVILYGSRARGIPSKISDYDVVGICKNGTKTRIAKKDGAYWDVFIYPEKDLKKFSEQQMGWKDAKIIFEKGRYGQNLLRRLHKFIEKPFEPAPLYEINVTKAWAGKQLERISVGDVHGLYRRVELQQAAISDYFQIRRKRFLGPKAGLEWLEKNDLRTFKAFAGAYKNPADMTALKLLVKRVYKIKLL